MVAAPDNRDLSNKEKEHTHTYSTERKKKKKKRRSDEKDSKESHRFHTAVQWKENMTVCGLSRLIQVVTALIL